MLVCQRTGWSFIINIKSAGQHVNHFTRGVSICLRAPTSQCSFRPGLGTGLLADSLRDLDWTCRGNIEVTSDHHPEQQFTDAHFQSHCWFTFSCSITAHFVEERSKVRTSLKLNCKHLGVTTSFNFWKQFYFSLLLIITDTDFDFPLLLAFSFPFLSLAPLYLLLVCCDLQSLTSFFVLADRPGWMSLGDK